MRPKILIVLEDTNRGGAETQALILAKGLIKRGYLIEILSFGYSGGSYWSEFESLGVCKWNSCQVGQGIGLKIRQCRFDSYLFHNN